MKYEDMLPVVNFNDFTFAELQIMENALIEVSAHLKGLEPNDYESSNYICTLIEAQAQLSPAGPITNALWNLRLRINSSFWPKYSMKLSNDQQDVFRRMLKHCGLHGYLAFMQMKDNTRFIDQGMHKVVARQTFRTDEILYQLYPDHTDSTAKAMNRLRIQWVNNMRKSIADAMKDTK